jgi:hypothetical protein
MSPNASPGLLPALPEALISQVGCALGCAEGQTRTDFGDTLAMETFPSTLPGVDLSRFLSQLDLSQLAISPLDGEAFNRLADSFSPPPHIPRGKNHPGQAWPKSSVGFPSCFVSALTETCYL